MWRVKCEEFTPGAFLEDQKTASRYSRDIKIIADFALSSFVQVEEYEFSNSRSLCFSEKKRRHVSFYKSRKWLYKTTTLATKRA